MIDPGVSPRRSKGLRLGVDLTACWRDRIGMVTFALGITEGLLEVDPDLSMVLFCSRERPPALRVPAQDERRVGALVSTLRHEVPQKLWWLPGAETEAEVDAMLYPYWPPPPRRRPGAPPAVTVIHDLAFRVRPDEVPWQQRLYLGSLLPPAVRQAAALLCPSEATRADLLDTFPAAGLEQRVTVVPEGPGIQPGEAASPLPAGLEPPFLLSVGTIEPRKNLPRLLRAIRRLRRSRPVPPLVIAGRAGWAYGTTLDLLRADPGVCLLGHVDDATLATLYRSATALCFPSLYEGFGLPLLEAMAAGLPALVGNQGSLPELAGGAALEVDPTDVGSIAQGLATLLDDEGLRTRLISAGRQRASGFTWAAAATRTLEVIHGVL
ncbi:MAG: glycosyltransferase family 4 protein [Candidatus Dormibacteraeota bacterium]|nr:glycosyltransferase family 4 protein [Candidatus Dormibacteraeota bacterium]